MGIPMHRRLGNSHGSRGKTIIINKLIEQRNNACVQPSVNVPKGRVNIMR
jgi:hypothetical protein